MPKEFRLISLHEFRVMGIEIWTSNENAMKDIPGHWGRFYAEGIEEKIPGRLGDDVIALYSDYEGDYTKPYSLTIGCKVSSINNIPKGMSAKMVPASNYLVLTAKGKMPDALVSVW